MGRHLQMQNSGIQLDEHHHHHHHHPGCMWGILHMLDYHYWDNLKRRLPYKRQARGRHFRCMGTPKTTSFNFDVDERQELMESENDLFLADQQDMEPSHANESVSGDTCKEEKNEDWATLGFPEKSWLQENQIILLNKGTDISSTRLHTPETESIVKQKLEDSKELKKQSLHNQFKEYADVLEIYKVNKEIFHKSRQYPDVGTKGNLNGKTRNAKFTKSGSFPAADLGIRSSMAKTLQDKQNEVWSLPKGDRFLKDTQMPSLTSSRSIKECYADLNNFAANGNVCRVMEQEARLSQGWTKLFRNHLKHIKLRIKNALKDNKKKNLGHGGADKPTSSYQNDYDHRKDSFGSMRRTSSIDESMERYVWLFDYSLNREAKRHPPNRLKLTSEDKLPSGRHCVKPYRRNASLPDMDSLCSSLTEVSHDAPLSIKTSTGYCKEDDEPNLVGETVDSAESEPLDSVVEPMVQWNVVGGVVEIKYQPELNVNRNKNEEGVAVAVVDYKSEKITELMMSNGDAHENNEICLEANLSKDLTQSIPLPVAETCFPDDMASVQELPPSQDSDIVDIIIKMDDLDCSAYLQNRPDTYSASDLSSHEKIASINNIVDHDSLHIKLDKKQEADFNYVKDVLEFSGFIGYEYFDVWHSVDQPLNPSLFKDLEALLYCEDETVGNCDRHLLFDLINEVLLDFYEMTLSYFPKALSCEGRVRPLPTGQRLLEEVWTRISQYLSLMPELEDSLDYFMSQDLCTGGWMNLHLETDCTTLELEELLFEDLLNEVICSQDC